MSDGSLLDERLEIETPERVVIAYDLAGIGSRFAAGTIDAAILLIPWCAAGCVAVALTRVSKELNVEEMWAVGLAVWLSCTAIVYVYYLGCELLLRGQTPGKRVLKLRVVSVHGGRASAGAIVLRNVLRLVDTIPVFLIIHVLGGLVMFLNRKNQRLGDLAAGTVVVRERPEELRVQRIAAAPGPAAVAAAVDDVLDRELLASIRAFLARRNEMRPPVRADLATRLLARVGETHELPRGNPEVLLGLLGAGRSPQEIRDMTGPRPGDAAAGMTGPAGTVRP